MTKALFKIKIRSWLTVALESQLSASTNVGNL